MLAPVFNIHDGGRCAIHELGQIVLCPAVGLSLPLALSPQGVEVKPFVVLVHFHITLYYFTFRVRLWERNKTLYLVVFYFWQAI